MDFSLDQRTATLSVGEFSGFVIGPRDSGGGPQGIWRAQLGSQWHRELQTQTTSETPAAQFEVTVQGRIFHRGWTLALSGRIDQIVPAREGFVLKEIKTVSRPLPADEDELRAQYPEYFAQLGAYVALKAMAEPSTRYRGELVFVEVDSGLSQTVCAGEQEDASFRTQLERITEFLDQRLRARDRLRHLSFRPAFEALRPGQETARVEIETALTSQPIVFFEAPTGFGKTGVTLETALSLMKAGRFERTIYLTSKSTGQIHVAETLARMTAGPDPGAGVMTWQIRNKREHCIHTRYHCSPAVCPHLLDLEHRWPRSGLSRFFLFNNEPRTISNLRAAGRDAAICPYEITRAALAFNDVWICDYNYVFAPASRGLLDGQPGYDPAQTLLIVDEAHNLPSRVADVYSQQFNAATAQAVTAELHRVRAPGRFLQCWEQWTHFLTQLDPSESLSLADEDDARHLIETVASLVTSTPLDSTVLGPEVMEQLWQLPSLANELQQTVLPRLWWCPQQGELSITCLDAGAAIGSNLRAFGAVLLVSATLEPVKALARDCGLDDSDVGTRRPIPAATETPAPKRLGRLNPKDTRKLYADLSSGTDLLRRDLASAAAAPAFVRAFAPWRDGAYDVAVDLRVDTSFQQRNTHAPRTAATIEALRRSAGHACAVFFSSYRYAEMIEAALRELDSELRPALQPRLPDLAAQTAWVEEALAHSDVLFLVLGSSFAEGIDLLGGRISHAMVVGPALPEVNPVQKARLAEAASLGREEAFRQVYQSPGIQKVNQALGRLVRAPGHTAKILLHCRRFAEPSYARLLAAEYRSDRLIRNDAELAAWLA